MCGQCAYSPEMFRVTYTCVVNNFIQARNYGLPVRWRLTVLPSHLPLEFAHNNYFIHSFVCTMELKNIAVFFLLTSLVVTIYAKPAVPVPNMPEPRMQDEHIPEGKQGELIRGDCCPTAFCRLNVCPGVPCC